MELVSKLEYVAACEDINVNQMSELLSYDKRGILIRFALTELVSELEYICLIIT